MKYLIFSCALFTLTFTKLFAYQNGDKPANKETIKNIIQEEYLVEQDTVKRNFT
ncbi:MAG: hypothetical protein KTR26_06010 [Flammeovirgaceae bacterium]|nr:hypothetical protein [Flammeovirgaceae bacterium]